MLRKVAAMKESRQQMIIRLIQEQNIETQEELARVLCENGFRVTQATVSRDIKEMRLIKVLTPEGSYRYATVEAAENDVQDRLIQMFSRCVTSVSSAGNIIVIKTISGSASVAAETVDSLKWPEIVGCIAGDNTIFLAVHDADAVPELIRKFQSMMQ